MADNGKVVGASNESSYLGCVAQARKPRAGEDWTRGSDLADGELDDEIEFDKAVNWSKPFHKFLAQNRSFYQGTHILIESVRDNKITLVRSSNDVGKTHEIATPVNQTVLNIIQVLEQNSS